MQYNSITNNDIEILEANEKKIKNINVNKFLPGVGKKTIKKFGVVSKAYVVGILSQLLNIPILSDIIKTAGVATSGLFSTNVATSILRHFFPYMEEAEYNAILNDVINKIPNSAAETPLFQNSYTNMNIVLDGVNGTGPYGWVGILCQNVSAFLTTHPELVIAGGAVLVASLGSLAVKIAKDIKINYLEKQIKKHGSKYQTETLKLLNDLLKNPQFRKTKHHRKFSELTDASIYIISKAGSLSDKFLVNLNELLKNVTNKINSGANIDLIQEYATLENTLQRIAIQANVAINEHNTNLKR